MLAGAAGANAAQPMERQVPPEVLRRMLQQQFGAQLGQVQQLVVLTQLFTYDALSDANCGRTWTSLQTPAGPLSGESEGPRCRQSIIEPWAASCILRPAPSARAKG